MKKTKGMLRRSDTTFDNISKGGAEGRVLKTQRHDFDDGKITRN